MLKPRWAGTVLDRRHGPLPLLAAPSASRLLTPNLMSCLSRVFDFRHGKYLRDTYIPFVAEVYSAGFDITENRDSVLMTINENQAIIKVEYSP